MSKRNPIFFKIHICCLHESTPKRAREMARNLLIGLAGTKMLTRCSRRVKRTQSPTKSGKIQWPDDVMCKLWLTIKTPPLCMKVYGSIDSYMGNIKRRVTGRHLREVEKWAYVGKKKKQNKNTRFSPLISFWCRSGELWFQYCLFCFSEAVESRIKWLQWKSCSIKMISLCNPPESALPHLPSEGQSHVAGTSNPGLSRAKLILPFQIIFSFIMKGLFLNSQLKSTLFT